MRTTLTLDDDVAERLKLVARRSARPFREVVNDTLRIGLAAHHEAKRAAPFKVNARDLGELRPGFSLDNVGDLLDQAEGPHRR